MANIVPQCKSLSCYIDGKFLFVEKIEEFNVPDLELLLVDANVDTPDLDVSLEIRGDKREILNALHRPPGNRRLELEIRAAVENDYGESVNAKWKCVGTIGDVSEMRMGTIGLNLDVHVYEHIIDGEEKYYIDIQKYIRRVDGVDQLEAIREGLGI